MCEQVNDEESCGTIGTTHSQSRLNRQTAGSEGKAGGREQHRTPEWEEAN